MTISWTIYYFGNQLLLSPSKCHFMYQIQAVTWFVAPEKFGCALLLYDCMEQLGRSHGRHTALLFGCSDRIRVPSFSPLTVPSTVLYGCNHPKLTIASLSFSATAERCPKNLKVPSSLLCSGH